MEFAENITNLLGSDAGSAKQLWVQSDSFRSLDEGERPRQYWM